MERSTFLPRHPSLTRLFYIHATSSGTNQSSPVQQTETRSLRRSEIAIETRSIEIVRLRIRARRPAHSPRRADDPPDWSDASHARSRPSRHFSFAHFL